MIKKNKEKLKIVMISHLFPGPARLNPNSGIFIKNQLREYKKYVDIFLYVPVDVTPSLSPIIKQSGMINKFRVLGDHFAQTIFKKLPKFDEPVKGKYLRFISLLPKSLFSFINGANLFLRLLYTAYKLRKFFNFNLIHGQTILPDGLAAVLLGKWFQCPTIVTVRGSDIHSIKKNSISYKTARFILNHANMITSVSQELKKKMISFGVPREKIVVIPNGVDPNFAKYNQLKDVRKNLKIPKDSPIFLSVGKLSQIKDPFTLLSAFKKLLQKNMNAYLIMVGGGLLEKEVLLFAERLNVKKRLHFTGYISHDEVKSYMSACDIFCLSSLCEGWPNVLFEAMSFGKPIVATDVGGIPEAICSQDYGFLVPPRQPDKMTEAMMKALHKKWDHKKIKDYASDNSWEKVAKKYFEIYHSVI